MKNSLEIKNYYAWGSWEKETFGIENFMNFVGVLCEFLEGESFPPETYEFSQE